MIMLLPLLVLLLARADDPAPKITIEQQNLGQLLRIRKIFVERLTGGDAAAQIRDMILSSLAGTHKFVITENPEGADATLRGSAEDLVFTEVHNTSDNVNVRGNAGRGRGRRRPDEMDNADIADAGKARDPIVAAASTVNGNTEIPDNRAAENRSIATPHEEAPDISRASWSAQDKDGSDEPQ